MQAKVIKASFGVRDGTVYPVDIAKGETVTGDLAATLVAAKLAVEIKKGSDGKTEGKEGGEG